MLVPIVASGVFDQTFERPAARFALTRMHPRLQKLPISTALAALLESSMERKHGEVYARAEALYNMAKDTGNTPDPQFPIVLSEMVQTFTGVYHCMNIV